MDRVFKKRSGRLFAALLSTALLAACSNNPFNPAAEPRILGVNSGGTSWALPAGYAGIFQSGTLTGTSTNRINQISYTYADPIVKVQSRGDLPPINFLRFTAEVTLADGVRLPKKEYPLNSSMIQGSAVSVSGEVSTTLSQDSTEIDLLLPILSANQDLLNVVFPGNNAPRVRDGRAKIALYGKDLNGHDVELSFETPLMFGSSVFNSDGLADIPQEAVPQLESTTTQSPTNSGGR